MIDDLLYGEIKKEGETRTETQQITDNLKVDFEVTTKDGQDHYLIKSITITSHGSLTVKVDDKTVVQPPQPFYDDGCYFKHPPLSPTPRTVYKVKAWGIVRNNWTPADFGHVGYEKGRKILIDTDGFDT